jgi:uncharacterized membrane protein YcjF (UPF0283 family)
MRPDLPPDDDADDDFTLAASPQELTCSTLARGDSESSHAHSSHEHSSYVDQSEGALGVTVDQLEVQAISSIDWEAGQLAGDAAYSSSAVGLATAPRGFSVAWRLAASCMLLLFLGSLLIAVAQTATLLANIQALPHPLRITFYVVLGCLWLALAIAVTSGLLAYLRLRRSPAISLGTLNTLTERSAAAAVTDLKEARTHIRQFLNEYPKTQAQLTLLSSAGIKEAGSKTTPRQLYSQIQYALDNDEENTEQWILQVRNHVVQPLDSAADALIRSRSMKVALKTALVQRGPLDMLVVLAHSWLLIRELCALYNLRPNHLETCFILGFVGLNALVADKGDEAAASLQQDLNENPTSYAGALAAAMLGQVASRGAEGTLNGLLTYRLGQQLKNYLTPIPS